MGKNSQGRTIRLTEQELKQLCEDAVDRGVAKYIKEQDRAESRKRRSLLYNTKKLLENYTKLKDYIENAISTVEEAAEVDETIVNTEVLIGFRLMDSDRKLNRQIRGINAVKMMLAHIDRMLEVYRTDCQTSSSEVKRRRWDIVQMMYLDRVEKKTTKQIAEYYNMELSGIQKEAKAARSDLTILFFGLDAMVMYDLDGGDYEEGSQANL